MIFFSVIFIYAKVARTRRHYCEMKNKSAIQLFTRLNERERSAPRSTTTYVYSMYFRPSVLRARSTAKNHHRREFDRRRDVLQVGVNLKI
ncbi:hypothetical protein PUN28_013419 [Cardiocondyla obscurior]|uniref:Secreted protein n=1 Tax=Cardiocondyla obscurior TaxID=286306 RepID=A0AAW2FC84_9HYME